MMTMVAAEGQVRQRRIAKQHYTLDFFSLQKGEIKTIKIMSV